jgi:exo-poly-alpha-galacturonosidase
LASSLFATAKPVEKKVKEYVITDHGAAADGQTLNTQTIQAVIDRCSKAGGGVVVVPKGTFLTGALFLKQGAQLRVERDGVLLGSADPNDYPQVATRWEGEEREWTAALINAVDLNDVALTGEGVIDGNGEEWLRRYPRLPAPRMGQAAPAPSPTRALLKTGKPRLICIQNCRRVRVAGLNLRNQAVWCLHVLYSEDVDLADLRISSAHTIPSSDGIDVDSSRRVRIARCDIDVNDDCISIKSGKDADGMRVNRPSEDIVIEDSRFGYGHGGVAMGSETAGGIRRVVVRRCVVEAGNWAPIRFKTQPSRHRRRHRVSRHRPQGHAPSLRVQHALAHGAADRAARQGLARVSQRAPDQHHRASRLGRNDGGSQRQPHSERPLRGLQDPGAERPGPGKRRRRRPCRPEPYG